MKGSRQFSLILCILAMSSWLQARTPAGMASEDQSLEPLHISLDGTWRLFYLPQGKYQVNEPEQLKAQPPDLD